jgi:23S rRNA (pseudouridine1915-N3)-methyltransferase
MRVTVAVVGRVRGELAPAVAEYEARAARYWRFEVEEVPAGLGSRRADPDAVMAAEGERLLGRIPTGVDVAALTRDGKSLSSRGLSDWLQELAVRGHPGVAFVIGGAYGLHPSVLARARRRVSLSAMTLPHEFARLVLAEQLYRAGTISRGEPYHKGP